MTVVTSALVERTQIGLLEKNPMDLEIDKSIAAAGIPPARYMFINSLLYVLVNSTRKYLSIQVRYIGELFKLHATGTVGMPPASGPEHICPAPIWVHVSIPAS